MKSMYGTYPFSPAREAKMAQEDIETIQDELACENPNMTLEIRSNLLNRLAELRQFVKVASQLAVERASKARARRATKDDLMGSLGMRRVRGNLGGTYYE